jgi:protein-S-isoprenylcysteine O-methyltransferase Ste14
MIQHARLKYERETRELRDFSVSAAATQLRKGAWLQQSFTLSTINYPGSHSLAKPQPWRRLVTRHFLYFSPLTFVLFVSFCSMTINE